MEKISSFFNKTYPERTYKGNTVRAAIALLSGALLVTGILALLGSTLKMGPLDQVNHLVGRKIAVLSGSSALIGLGTLALTSVAINTWGLKRENKAVKGQLNDLVQAAAALEKNIESEHSSLDAKIAAVQSRSQWNPEEVDKIAKEASERIKALQEQLNGIRESISSLQAKSAS